MANIVVDTTSDVTDAANGLTSLLDAIALANSNPDQSTITFAAGVGEAFETGGTITLGGTQLELSSDITIDGNVDGDAVDRRDRVKDS